MSPRSVATIDVLSLRVSVGRGFGYTFPVRYVLHRESLSETNPCPHHPTPSVPKLPHYLLPLPYSRITSPVTPPSLLLGPRDLLKSYPESPPTPSLRRPSVTTRR